MSRESTQTPSSNKNRRTGGFVLIGLATLTGISFLGLALYVWVVTQRIDGRIEQLRSTRATQFLALYPPLKPGLAFATNEIRALFFEQGYLEQKSLDDLKPGEYFWKASKTEGELHLYRPAFSGAGREQEPSLFRFQFEQDKGLYVLKEIRREDKNENADSFEGIPKKVASYFAGRLRTQNAVPLSDIPLSLRNAIMAIEDIHFLEHVGVSFRGTLRALWADLVARKFVQGGSTITQQLMKNLFFSREKAISRKFKEALFAFITEVRHSKEDILEAYLNEVYMGQWGPHEIHGVSEGASYYFNRPVSELSLAQSATLAAIVQAPNAHDPNRYPEKSSKRRNLVLKKMLDAEFIQDDEYEEAIKEPLGVVSASRNLADIDYAVDLVLSQLPSDVRSRMENEALTVYMTLNPYLQSEASGAMNANIQRLIKASKDIAKREKKNIHLQGALIAIDVKTCGILAVQGGRSYRQTQFNRITQGRRQPGSLFKPFVALAALANPAIQVIPTTEFEDSAFEWKYDKQVWTPRNYDKEYRGKVTMRRLLEQSINIPTARLAEMTGIESIYNTLQAAGIKSRLPAVPSLSLGSADVNPLEVAESYVTLANLGKACALRSYSEVWDENKNLINQNPIQIREALPAAPTFMTVNMMKGTLTHGTARSIMYTNLPYSIFSGKTGTTNDYKDAWFVGFSPGFLVLTWVGYDEEEKVGLTGSAAAVPLWVDFVQRSRPFVGLDDFVPPDGVKLIKIDRNGDPNCSDVIDEYFPSGKEPSQSCG